MEKIKLIIIIGLVILNFVVITVMTVSHKRNLKADPHQLTKNYTILSGVLAVWYLINIGFNAIWNACECIEPSYNVSISYNVLIVYVLYVLLMLVPIFVPIVGVFLTKRATKNSHNIMYGINVLTLIITIVYELGI